MTVLDERVREGMEALIARKLGLNALLVTDDTRADSERYRAALGSFSR